MTRLARGRYKDGSGSAFATRGLACQGKVLSYQGVSSVCQLSALEDLMARFLYCLSLSANFLSILIYELFQIYELLSNLICDLLLGLLPANIWGAVK